MEQCSVNSFESFNQILSNKDVTKEEIYNFIRKMSKGEGKSFPLDIVKRINTFLIFGKLSDDVKKILSSINNTNAIENIIKGNVDTIDKEINSKTDNIDDLNKRSRSKLLLEHFIRNAWNNNGTSMGLYRNNLIKGFIKLCYFQNTKFRKEQDIETAIREYQQSLIDNIKEGLKNTKYYGSIKNLEAYDSSGRCNILEFLNNVREYFDSLKKNPFVLLGYSIGKRESLLYADFVTLDNFDQALLLSLGDSIGISNFGIYSDIDSDNPKWYLTRNTEVSTTWRDDNTEQSLEVSEGIQSIIKLYPMWNNKTVLKLSEMTFDSVKDVITRLVDTHKLSSIIVTNKDLTETEIQTLDLDGNSIFVPSNSVKSIFEEIYGKEQIDKIINLLTNKTLQEILVLSKQDPATLFPIFFSLLVNTYYNKLEENGILNSNQLNTLYGIYLNFFSTFDPESGAEMSLFKRALNSGYITNNKYLGLENDNFYNPYIGFILSIQSIEGQHILEYVDSDEGIVAENTSKRTRDKRLQKLQNQIVARFSVESSDELQIDNVEIISELTTDDKNKSNENTTYEDLSFKIIIHGKNNVYSITKKHRSTDNKDSVEILINDKGLPELLDDIQDLFPLLSEVFRFDFNIEIWNQLKNIYGNDKTVAEKLLTAVTDVLYNYEVAKKLKEQGIVRIDDYKLELSKYYNTLIDENTKKQYETTDLSNFPGIDYIQINPLQLNSSLGLSYIYYNLSLAKDIVEQIYSSSTNKDAANKSIMNATLSQVASKAAELWIQGAKKPGACGQFFDIYDLYRGTSFNRNFSSKGVTKEAKAFNEAEFYLANLLYDYFANRDSKNASINVMAAVISDKNKLIKVKFALNKNIKGYNKPLIEFSESELKSWISDRLGTFYRTMYNNIKSEFKILQSVSKEVFGKEIPINLETDFAEFNEFCKDKNLDSDIVLHELVYAALQKGYDVNITENSYYVKTKNEILTNPSLIHLLYIWEKLTDLEKTNYFKIFGEGGTRPIDLIFENKENYFKSKNLLLATLLIQDGVVIETRDHYFGARKDNPAIKKIYELCKSNPKTNEKGWITTVGNIAIFKIISKNGDNTYETKISTRRELKESFIYKRTENLIKSILYYPELEKYFPKNYLNIFNIDSPYFDLNAFVEFQNDIENIIYLKNVIDDAVDYEISRNQEKYSKLSDSKIEKEFIKYVSSLNLEETHKVNTLNKYKTPYQQVEYLAKHKSNDLIKNTSIEKLLETTQLEKEENFNTVSIEVNPELIKHNLIDLGLGEQYMNSTVGTFLNHPAGGDYSNIRLIESGMYGQLTKRNVSLTATKHEFARNLLNGVLGERKIVVVREPRNKIYTIGESGSSKVFDGATYCNMLTNYAENASLGFDGVGFDKKQFVHFYKENSGTGGIIKTAGFVVTNERISKGILSDDNVGLDYRMNKLLNDTLKWSDWLKLQGIELPYHDWTKDYLKNNIDFGKWYIYRNGKYYVRSNPRISKNGETIVSEYKITKDGIETNEGGDVPVGIIDSNFQLWEKVFGGYNSANFIMDSQGNKTLSTSACNSSSELLYKAYCKTGYRSYKDGVVLSGSSVKQIMKDCAIDYIVTEGAIKQGAANINPLSILYVDNPKVTIMKFNGYDMGIQLDAEHAADDSVISLMTLVANALGARGYSWSEALDIYEALHRLTTINLAGILDGIKSNLNEKEQESFRNAVAKIIYNSLTSLDSNSGNLLAAIADSIIDLNEGTIGYELIKGKLPISNPIIFKKILSNIASSLTRSCIKSKFPGGLEVLNPSDGRFKLVNGKPMSYYDTEEKKNKLQEDAKIAEQTAINTADINLDSFYYIKDIDGNYYTYDGKQFVISPVKTSVKIDSPEMYRNLRRQLTSAIISKDILSPRDLACYNCRFSSKDGRRFQIWDLAIIEQYDNIRKLRKSAEKEGLDATELLEQEKAAHYELLRTLNALSDGAMNKVNVISVNSKGEPIIETIEVDKNTLKIDPYELIAPKIYATVFGLTAEDNLDEILNDKLFFLKRSLLNRRCKVNDNRNYDLELKTIKGNHYYLLFDHKSRNIPEELLQKEIKINWSWEDGKMVRIINDDIAYDIPFTYDEEGRAIPNVRIFKDSTGQEIIYTNNITFFLDNLHYNKILVSSNITDNLEEYQINSTFAHDLIEKIQRSSKNPAKNFILSLIHSDEIYDANTNILNVNDLNSSAKNINDEKGRNEKQLNELKEKLATDEEEYKNYINNNDEFNTINFDEIVEDMENSLEETRLRIDSIKTPVNITYILYRLALINKRRDKLDQEFEEKVKLGNLFNINKFLETNPLYYGDYNYAIELHTSFIKSLNFVAARIPALSHQSFMAMRNVLFDDSGLNSAYVSRYLLYLQGSDYALK